MNIFICDDEEICIKQLTTLLRKYFEENRISDVKYHSFSSGEDLLKSNIVPDLVFLDIEMGAGLSGTHVGKKLQEKYPNTKIFIITAHIEYLDEAFRFSFFRFILKPVQKHALFRNISDAFYQRNVELKEVIIETRKDPNSRDPKSETFVVHARDIVAIAVENRGTKIFLNDRTVLSKRTISSFGKMLSGTSFFSTHRDYLINLRYVDRFIDDKVILKYKNGQKIEAYLAKAHKKTCIKAFHWYRERIYEYL